MGIQVIGPRKTRKAERQTGLTIDRLVRLDNHHWEARVLTDTGHIHLEIRKSDWDYRQTPGPCWSSCDDLDDTTRTRQSDIPLLPYAGVSA